MPSPADNKQRTLELVERVLNGGEVDALDEFTTNPDVAASGAAFHRAFPTMRAEVRWAVAEDDMVVLFLETSGAHLGPWIWVPEPTGRHVEAGYLLAFRFDDAGMIVDQWIGGNHVATLGQLGWGVAPVGEVVA